jgi:hypothetical protein
MAEELCRVDEALLDEDVPPREPLHQSIGFIEQNASPSLTALER